MRTAAVCLIAAFALCARVNAQVQIRPAGSPGRYTGFDLLYRGKVVAPVRFSSRSGPGNQPLITAKTLSVERRRGVTLAFGGLTPHPACGLRLDPADFIRVSLSHAETFPRIQFRLTIRRFDEKAWQTSVGKCPFHFLTLSLPQAEVWHQRGWLNATPLSDPFPLLIDPHAGSPEIAAKYSRNWSYTPPLGAQPIPVIGLWAPKKRLYVGFEFQSTRLLDNSEKDIATGYCWKQGALDGQFVALVYPYGGVGYQDLVFPKAGSQIASSCTLLFDANMPADRDPNQMVWAYVWQRYRRLLPTAPASNDLSWVPGGARLRDFEGPPGPELVATAGRGDPFVLEGTKTVSGWYKHKESVVDALAAQQNPAALARLAADLRYVLGKVKRVRFPEGYACFWEKPLEGSWNSAFGGKPVTTLHNTDAWYIGRVLVDLYRHRNVPHIASMLKDLGLTPERLLELVNGVLIWTKHFTFTRNEFADVPSSPFAIGGTLSASFCLDYYFTFRNHPKYAKSAVQALQLARTVTYRYLTMWMSDSNRADGLDSSFLWEPNSGRDWCGAACANEVHWNLDTLAMVAVHTGDPILIHALRGTLERWPQLYKERFRASIAKYEHDAMTEGFGLYEGNVYGGVGARASYGTASALPMLEPVGNSRVRVLCGLKSALAFDRGEGATKLLDYRCRFSNGPYPSLAFTVDTMHPAPFDLSLTFPFGDLRSAPVRIKRGGMWLQLSEGAGLRRPPQARWSLYISGLRSGDRVFVGQPEALRKSSVGSTTPPLMHGFAVPSVHPFQILRLAPASPARRDWEDTESWAGLWEGLHFRYGVPYLIRTSRGGPLAGAGQIKISPPVVGPAVLYVAYSYSPSGSVPVVGAVGPRGRTTLKPEAAQTALAWRAWPPPFKARLLLAPVHIPAGSRADSISFPGGLVFAATALSGSSKNLPLIRTVNRNLTKANADWVRLLDETRQDEALRRRMRPLPLQKIAVLPPGLGGGPLALMLGRAGIADEATRLSPEQLVSPDVFNPAKFPVALFLPDGEEYIRTVRSEGDAADALVRYVSEGGLLVVCASGPYPMFYHRRDGALVSEPLMPRLGMPLAVSFEQPPAGERLTVVADAGRRMFPDMPDRVPFPPGDPRLRAFSRSLAPADAEYIPICRVVGSSGRDYGDAAGLLLLPAKNGRRGGVLYVWFGLWRDARLQKSLAQGIFNMIEERLSAQ